MDKTTVLSSLEELVSDELKGLVKKGSLSPQELEAAEKGVCIMEKLAKLKDGTYMDPSMSYGRYSMRGSYDMPIRSYGYYPMDESFMRGRDAQTGRYVSRDGYSAGRYYGMPSYGAFDRGYSGHSIADRAVDRLEAMMDEAKTDYERDMVRRFIELIRSEQ